MGFLVPAFLAGLAAVVVPIVLHLRHRDKDTPHRFPVADVRRAAADPHGAAAPDHRLALLLLRALAIVLLVLAFARPLWSRPGVIRSSQGDRTVIVLLDRSMSMGHTGVWPRALEEARRAIAGLGTTDRVALVLFDDEAEIAQPLTTTRISRSPRSRTPRRARRGRASPPVSARRARSRPTRAPAPRRSTSCSSPTCSAADSRDSPASSFPPRCAYARWRSRRRRRAPTRASP
jgi:hypothetical protein